MKNWDKVEADVNMILNRHFTKGRGGHKVEFIGIHYNAANLTIEGCYSVWQNREASAHYQVEDGGRIGQLVWDADTAWALGNFNANQRSISIEHANRPDGTISEACLDNGAHLVAALCKMYGLGRPQWGTNVKPHKAIVATSCPGQIYGSQKDAYIQRAQQWYDSMVNGGAAPAPKPQVPSPAPAPKPQSSEHTGTGFGGTYTCMVGELHVRTAPSINASIVASYHKGQTVTLDDWYKIADGYVWGKYTGGSGNVRYVAVGKATGKVSNDDFLIKGGHAPVHSLNLGDKRYWGPAYTKALQRNLGTPVDGIISSQPAVNKKYLACADPASWQFVQVGNGSTMVKALQKKIGNCSADGFFGHNTAKALQKYLVNLGFGVGNSGIDGYLGSDSCIALGKALEAGKF